MAKTSAIEKNKRRRRLVTQYAAKRARFKAIAEDMAITPEERFQARLKLAAMPRDGSPVRVRLRCELTGRPRGNYRKFRISRIALRDLASDGKIPGVVKASW
jgi:small subunit ribosomal protein S14